MDELTTRNVDRSLLWGFAGLFVVTSVTGALSAYNPNCGYSATFDKVMVLVCGSIGVSLFTYLLVTMKLD